MPPFPLRIGAPPRFLLPIHSPRPRDPISISERLHALTSRAPQDVTTVPQSYGNGPFGPDAGTVVGITLGSVAGFLLLLAIIYWCINLGTGPQVIEEGSVGGGTASVVSRHSRPRPHRHRRSKHSPRRETVEIRRERVVPVAVEREERIIVEEQRARSRSISRPPPPPRAPDHGDDDEIIVMEETTPPRRRRDSMRSQHTRRSEERRSTFRDDPYARDMGRRGSGSRR
ncbi:hypothetical protein F5Y19DRAFT_471610 [Xylariaceae sp. FL1651]|nr:hypothetical protein F5Y19DRAFT_471610 [Xylariaceae sp. FL1651]